MSRGMKKKMSSQDWIGLKFVLRGLVQSGLLGPTPTESVLVHFISPLPTRHQWEADCLGRPQPNQFLSTSSVLCRLDTSGEQIVCVDGNRINMPASWWEQRGNSEIKSCCFCWHYYILLTKLRSWVHALGCCPQPPGHPPQ